LRRDRLIARGVFTSVSDLRRKLMRFKWRYRDRTRRVTIDSAVTVR
jgi:hypothetical protein